MDDILLEITNARKSIRNLYIKYGQELYDISFKIDKYLELLQNNLKTEEVKSANN